MAWALDCTKTVCPPPRIEDWIISFRRGFSKISSDDAYENRIFSIDLKCLWTWNAIYENRLIDKWAREANLVRRASGQDDQNIISLSLSLHKPYSHSNKHLLVDKYIYYLFKSLYLCIDIFLCLSIYV